jgi:hypothetical protein
MTRRGSAMGFAGPGTMARVSADAASMKIGTGVAELAGRIASPVETELLPVRGKHGVLASAVGGECGGWLARHGLVCFAVCWEVSGGTATKTMRTLALLWGLREPFRGKAPLHRRSQGIAHMERYWTSSDDG